MSKRKKTEKLGVDFFTQHLPPLPALSLATSPQRGFSQLGGTPLLPPGFAWPMRNIANNFPLNTIEHMIGVFGEAAAAMPDDARKDRLQSGISGYARVAELLKGGIIGGTPNAPQPLPPPVDNPRQPSLFDGLNEMLGQAGKVLQEKNVGKDQTKAMKGISMLSDLLSGMKDDRYPAFPPMPMSSTRHATTAARRSGGNPKTPVPRLGDCCSGCRRIGTWDFAGATAATSIS